MKNMEHKDNHDASQKDMKNMKDMKDMPGMDHDTDDHGHMNHDHMSHEHMDHQMDMGHDNHQMAMGDMDHQDMMMHGGHMMHMGNLKQKFWVSIILTIPILLMTSMMGMTKPLLVFPGSTWVVALIGIILFIYGGQPSSAEQKGNCKPKNRQ